MYIFKYLNIKDKWKRNCKMPLTLLACSKGDLGCLWYKTITYSAYVSKFSRDYFGTQFYDHWLIPHSVVWNIFY